MVVTLARVVRVVAAAVCAIIALAAVLIGPDANTAKWTVVLNYGIAIVVYAIVAALVVRLLLAPVAARRREPVA